jgi:hypothetical protein
MKKTVVDEEEEEEEEETCASVSFNPTFLIMHADKTLT